MAEYQHTDEFRDARFFEADVSGARFHSCDLRRVKITDSELADFSVSGILERVLVNDIDVTDYVQSELDRRYPERVQVRSLKTPADYRAMWDTIERLWAGMLDRVRALPEPARYEQVDGEWSFTETMRHLIFATDKWAAVPILDQENPFHPLGLAHSAAMEEEGARFGITPAATPSLDEVMEVRADRMAMVRRIVDGLTEAEIARDCARPPHPGYPIYRVGSCLGVIMDEECEHRRYADRDLTVLEARSPQA